MKTTISQKRARRYNRDVPIELAISAIAMPPSQNCNPAIMYVCLCGQTLDEPPLEEHLCQNTLWPEMHKLYGHGNEVYAVAHTNSHINALLASACKAQSPQAAEIILWDSVKGCEVQRLSGHNLTVTSLAFSPNDEYLVTTTICQSRRTEPVQKAIRMLALVPIDQQVSTSRDRALCLYSRDDKGRYSLSSTVKKAHDRILWSCSFSPQALQLGQGQGGSSKGLYVVATGSRDKSLKTWLVDDTSGTACLSLLDTVKQFSVSHSGREGWLAGWLAGLSPALPPQNAAPTTERQQHRRRFGNTRKSHLALSPPSFRIASLQSPTWPHSATTCYCWRLGARRAAWRSGPSSLALPPPPATSPLSPALHRGSLCSMSELGIRRLSSEYARAESARRRWTSPPAAKTGLSGSLKCKLLRRPRRADEQPPDAFHNIFFLFFP